MKPSFGVLVLLAVILGVAEGGVWRKLNGPPVCFHTTGSRYGSFNYNGPTLRAWSFALVHRSGWVSCAGKGANVAHRSHWGCAPFHPNIGTFLTDCNNKVIGPKFRNLFHKAWYRMQGYFSSSPVLVFPMTNGHPNQRFFVKHTMQFRLWYGEDLTNHTEGDNNGRSCADLYAYV